MANDSTTTAQPSNDAEMVSDEFAPLASDEATADRADGATTVDRDALQRDSDGCGRRSRRRRCCYCAAATALLLGVFLTVVLIGRAVELRAVSEAPGTDELYLTDWVCARDEAGNERSIRNHSLLEASASALSVVHCAKCGACSSEADMAIYNATRFTITETATSVALGVFLGGAEAVREGFRERVGFTEPCNDCWTADVLCTQQHCKFTCLTHMLFSGGLSHISTAEEDGALNDCIRCDEQMCGPEFAQCAGANRRRAGMLTDINRPERLLCADPLLHLKEVVCSALRSPHDTTCRHANHLLHLHVARGALPQPITQATHQPVESIGPVCDM